MWAKAERDGDVRGLLVLMEVVAGEAVSASEGAGAFYKYRFQGHGIKMKVGSSL